MLKRLENVHFSGRNASGLYNIERGKGYHPQRCQMSQELLSEAVGSRWRNFSDLIFCLEDLSVALIVPAGILEAKSRGGILIDRAYIK